MKSLILSLLTLTSALTSTLAVADSLAVMPAAPKIYTANLETVNFDENAPAGFIFDRGTVSVDRISGQIEITMYPAMMKCMAVGHCQDVAPAPHVITLPLVSKVKDQCGNMHYVAMIDARPVDGALEQIDLVDYSRNTCTDMVYPSTYLEYKTSVYDRINGREVNLLTTMTASKLVSDIRFRTFAN